MGPVRVEANELESLIALLKKNGLEVIGPTLQNQAIVYDVIESTKDLPQGWVDEQSPGNYRVRQEGRAYFGYNVGPNSWKQFLLVPKQKIFEARISDQKLDITPAAQPIRRRAFLGVRSCELAAIEVQDRVFAGGRDPLYERARADAFIVVVQCTRSVETCFCVSMKTGPEARSGFDWALTEVVDEPKSEHFFIVEPGSEEGRQLLSQLQLSNASSQQLNQAKDARARASEQQIRSIPVREIKEVLQGASESPLWSDIATRCLSCANCTLACPTCFCTTVEDTTDLTGDHAERWKRWDSCFNSEFSYIHGGSVRTSIRSKYRQWMTHKLAHWWDQFDTSGCVGCGRCITWCPVGIDITAESARFMEEKK